MRPLSPFPSSLPLDEYLQMKPPWIGDPSNGRKGGVFKWKVGGGDQYESTQVFIQGGEGTTYVQAQENIIWPQAITKGVVPWNRLVLYQRGFSRSQADHSLYIKKTGELLLVIILYVKNLIILTSNIAKLK